jgi:hypothetical protein
VAERARGSQVCDLVWVEISRLSEVFTVLKVFFLRRQTILLAEGTRRERAGRDPYIVELTMAMRTGKLLPQQSVLFPRGKRWIQTRSQPRNTGRCGSLLVVFSGSQKSRADLCFVGCVAAPTRPKKTLIRHWAVLSRCDRLVIHAFV